MYIDVFWEPADTRYIRADTCAGRSVLFGGGDVALVHKYLHILRTYLGSRLILGTYELIPGCTYVVHNTYTTLVRR